MGQQLMSLLTWRLSRARRENEAFIFCYEILGREFLVSICIFKSVRWYETSIFFWLQYLILNVAITLSPKILPFFRKKEAREEKTLLWRLRGIYLAVSLHWSYHLCQPEISTCKAEGALILLCQQSEWVDQ